MTNKPLTGHTAALFTVLVWGTTFISTKVLLEVFSPIEILVIRFVIGYVVLWCVYPKNLPFGGKRQELYFAAAGLCGVTLYYLLENIALTFTMASNVGVILSVAPFFTVIFGCLFLHDKRPSGRFFMGFLIAMAGIVLISFGNGASFQVNPLGDILAVIAAVVWAAYSTITKKISEFGYNTIQTTRRTFFYGLIFMLPAVFTMDFHLELSAFLNVTVVLNLLFLSLCASALCFVTWNLAVKILGPAKTGVYLYTSPVITTITSALILKEPVTPIMVGGIVLTLVGLFLSENRSEGENADNHDDYSCQES